MMRLLGVCAVLLAGISFSATGKAEVVKDFDLKESGQNALPIRSLLGITSQGGYSGMSVSKILVCGTSQLGRGVVYVLENQSQASAKVTLATTPNCYYLALPMPGELDNGIDTIQLVTNGNIVITRLGAY